MQKIFLFLSTILLVLLAGTLGWMVLYTDGLLASEQVLQWTQFLGRFHPVILHLPIGLFLGLLVIEFFSLRKCSSSCDRAAQILVWLMTLTSMLTAYLGLLLASSGDYSGDTLWWHKWLGVAFSAVSLLVTFFKVLSQCFEGKGLSVYRLLLLGLLVLLPIVGHNGGELTHGKGYLTKYAPDWLRDKLAILEDDKIQEAELESITEEGNLFTQEVQPILDQYCVSCHGPEKQKSKYRLDTYEALLTPGSMGDTTVEPYSMSESFLLEYMLLPEDDDMAMPPEGKSRPSAEEVLLIAHWIAMGAEGPPVDVEALAAAKAATEAELAKVSGLFYAGVLLLPVGQDSELLYLDFQNLDASLSDDILDTLESFKERIAEVKMADISEPIKVLQILEGAPKLRVLNLNGLKRADAAVDILNSMTSLGVINLFGSDLSGVGLSKLKLPNLQKLYVGSTAVTANELAAYRQANTSTDVYGDVDLATIDAIKEEDLQNSAAFIPKEK